MEEYMGDFDIDIGDKKEKDKVGRILTIYSKLMNGDVINKAEEARHFGVNERSIQRDIDYIRN